MHPVCNYKVQVMDRGSFPGYGPGDMQTITTVWFSPAQILT